MTREDRAFLVAQQATAESWRKNTAEMPAHIPTELFLRALDVIERLDRELNEDIMSQHGGTASEDTRSPQLWTVVNESSPAEQEIRPIATFVLAEGAPGVAPRIIEVDRAMWEQLNTGTGYRVPDDVLADCETLIRLARQLADTVSPSLFRNVLGPLGGDMLPRLLDRLESVLPLT